MAMLQLEVKAKVVHLVKLINIITSEEKEIRIGSAIIEGNSVYSALFTCLDAGFEHQAITWNLYNEYQRFRAPLEQQGWRFKTKGALKTCRPSGMSIDMSFGILAYIFKEGATPTTQNDLVGIFDDEARVCETDTVEAQHTFWENYLHSLKSSA